MMPRLPLIGINMPPKMMPRSPFRLVVIVSLSKIADSTLRSRAQPPELDGRLEKGQQYALNPRLCSCCRAGHGSR